MPNKNQLLTTPPYAIEQRLKKLGVDLRIARIRRGLTILDVAEKIGTGVRAVTDAEKGKASTGIAVYFALLWVFGLLGPLDDIADPVRDIEGQRLALSREKIRGRHSNMSNTLGGDIDNDF